MLVRRLVIVFAIMVCSAAPMLVFAQGGSNLYKTEILTQTANTVTKGGRNVREITVEFRVIKQNVEVKSFGEGYQIRVMEEGIEKRRIDLLKPVRRVVTTKDLTLILAVDTSGSMKDGGRIEQARNASKTFFTKLPAEAEAGLVLFNHAVYLKPLKLEDLVVDRQPLLDEVDKAVPDGGTAYLQACWDAIQVLKDVKKLQKAVVVMTDGVDLNSEKSMQEVIKEAKAYRVPIFTIGIGKAGKNTPVTSVLVLDKSLSMKLPANDRDPLSKIAALQAAAQRFIKIIPEQKDSVYVRSSVLEFSDKIKMPSDFTHDKNALVKNVNELVPSGETAFIDATYDALMALIAKNPEGRRAVITLTDGVDNSSRRRVDEVIELAKSATTKEQPEGIPVFMLGFGQKSELDEKVMKQIAYNTGKPNEGYYYAGDQQKLVKIFEQLAIQVHDDGIDEKTLKTLANSTGGEYHPAENVDKLDFVLGKVKEVLVKETVREVYEVSFESKYQEEKSDVQNVELELWKFNPDSGEYFRVDKKVAVVVGKGIILAQLSPAVYLVFLAILGVLAALPAGMNRVFKKNAA